MHTAHRTQKNGPPAFGVQQAFWQPDCRALPDTLCVFQSQEASVAAGARRNVQALLQLQCLLLESAVLAHLTMTEHAQAQQHILSMRQLYSRFSTLLQGALHSIHMVTGRW